MSRIRRLMDLLAENDWEEDLVEGDTSFVTDMDGPCPAVLAFENGHVVVQKLSLPGLGMEEEWTLALRGTGGFVPGPRESGAGKTGELTGTLAALVAVLGSPNLVGSPDGKVRVEWSGKVEWGRLSVWDWKTRGPIEEVEVWSVCCSTATLEWLQKEVDNER